MRRLSTINVMGALLLTLPCLFQACVKDTCKSHHTYTYFEPVYKTKESVRANIKSNAPRPIENPGKIYVLGHTIFLNEIDKGIHVIDNTDPSHPHNTAFIDIPGNMDIAAKGTTLYADLYTDLVTLDISNPSSVVVKSIIEGVFPNRIYTNGFVPNTGQIITDWVRRDTTVTESCNHPFFTTFLRSDVFFLANTPSAANAAANNTPAGVGGSMARFTIMNNRLYTVNANDLAVFNITAPASPTMVNHVNVGWGIETIYPFKDKLFVGSSAGMFIYNVSNPDVPVSAGQFVHVRSCDPVVADGNFAYVTLSSGTACLGFTNELDIVNISNFIAPALQKVYPMTNPHGLSKDGNLLFICDGSAGLKVYNAGDVNNLQLLGTIGNMETYDIIAYNNWALLVAKDGLYQYSYSSAGSMQLLSKMELGK